MEALSFTKEFKKSQIFKINNAQKLYHNSFCLPSGQNLSKSSIKKLQYLNKFKR